MTDPSAGLPVPDDDRLLMTPGPTALPPSVRSAMGRPLVHPDVEPEFTGYYRDLLDDLRSAYGTDDDVLVLGGEGILGLEAAMASVLSPGDEVLCLANGVYGAGFADFVEMQGAVPTVHETDWRTGFDPRAIEELVADGEYVAATMVHCETPTGLLNDLDEVLGVLQDAGVLTVVDAVSSLGGTPVPVDRIDVCLGASQKCFSSPPGLTTVSMSDRAWELVEAAEQDTFYTSFGPWQGIELDPEEPVLLPYSHLVSNLYALEASLELFLDEGRKDVFARHEAAAERCRSRGRDLGLQPFPGPDRCSPTVTAFEVEQPATELVRRVADEENVVLATGLGDLEDDVLRVGHMGYNAEVGKVDRAMDALSTVLD